VGVSEEDVDDFKEKCDLLPNLQLLDGPPNQEKSATPFAEWLEATCPGNVKRAAYCERNFIPDCSHRLEDFGGFFEKRRGLLRDALTKILVPTKK